MEFELWWLLALPLFFGLGWLAARVDIRQVMTESRAVPASYFRGLNYLLNEQPDRAIEAFIEVVKVDSDTVDLHFALGGLFRKRGEVERAIRMHQNLVEREDLSAEQQIKARFELGQDYLKAGLLDRAEAIFTHLNTGEMAEQARNFLLEIYVQEKDWSKAISAAQELSRGSNQTWHVEIGHYYCELANQAWLGDQIEVARAYLSDALTANRDCVRANMLLGDIAIGRDEVNAAITAWRRVESQKEPYLTLVAERIMAAYCRAGREADGLAFLRHALNRQASHELFDIEFSAVLRLEGAQAAWVVANEQLRRSTSLRSLDRMLEAEIMIAPSERQAEVQLVKQAVHAHVHGLLVYQCQDCGFKARSFFWRCPACGQWDSFPPQRKED
ncbi:MAG: lipopolysaccharide assembly protein LapB [Betaproteobacteria bacterium]|nr:lipopolysaccharide assembly protein LapB [Betaproteobacteria bacterium]